MIIGILGLANSGKSLAAEILGKHLACPVVSVSAPIKAMLLGMGLQPEDLRGKSKTKPIHWIGKTPRDLMQSLGDWGRSQNANLWATILDARLASVNVAIVDDIRLPLEAAVVRKRGGRLVRIIRPGLEPSGHHTERAGQLIEADITISNAGSPDELQAQLLEWTEEGEG